MNFDEKIDNIPQEWNNKDEILEAIDEINKELEELSNKITDMKPRLEASDFEKSYAKNSEKKEQIEATYGSPDELAAGIQLYEEKYSRYEAIIADLRKKLADYKNFNKMRFFDNVRFLLKDNSSVKIGQIEKEAGVSAGYMSRMEKEGNTSDPSVELVYTAAKLLGVSLDTLLNIDLTALNPTEKYLIEFIQKLELDTISDSLEWNTESAEDLNRLEGDINGNPGHPLFSLETFFEQSDSEYPEQVTDIRFVSRSFGCHTCISDTCFNLGMKNGSRLYLMDICKSVHYSNDPDAYAKEIWMYKPGAGTQYLIGTKDAQELANAVETLFSTVKMASNHPKVSSEVRSVIDAFMAGDLGQNDVPDLPFA